MNEKSRTVSVRMTENQRKAIAGEAERLGVAISAYMLQSTLERIDWKFPSDYQRLVTGWDKDLSLSTFLYQVSYELRMYRATAIELSASEKKSLSNLIDMVNRASDYFMNDRAIENLEKNFD